MLPLLFFCSSSSCSLKRCGGHELSLPSGHKLSLPECISLSQLWTKTFKKMRCFPYLSAHL